MSTRTNSKVRKLPSQRRQKLRCHPRTTAPWIAAKPLQLWPEFIAFSTSSCFELQLRLR